MSKIGRGVFFEAICNHYVEKYQLSFFHEGLPEGWKNLSLFQASSLPVIQNVKVLNRAPPVDLFLLFILIIQNCVRRQSSACLIILIYL